MTSPQWRTSSYSGPNGNCVEVARMPDVTLVRDTKHRNGGHLVIGTKQWQALVGLQHR